MNRDAANARWTATRRKVMKSSCGGRVLERQLFSRCGRASGKRTIYLGFYGAIHHQSHNLIHILFGKPALANKEAHIECAVEGVEREVEIEVSGKLAARDSATQGFVSFLPAGHHEAVPKGLYQFGIGLPAADQCGDNASTA